MYSEVITDADQTFAANRRVRAQSLDLRAHMTALMLTYRAHRFPQLCGASDESPIDRTATMRSKIRSGALPRPAEAPEKCWGGKGTKRLCHGCAVAIAAEDVEYELDIAGGGTLLFCASCLAAWNVLREERVTS